MKKYNKHDYINLLIIIISFFIFLFIILKDNNSVYGSMLDYITQHYMVPEYFRTLFYDTKDIIPSFAFNLGMGQNIFNFSYYGLLSPIILLSYLLPSINMSSYIMISSIIIVIISIVLFYKLISFHFENRKIRFITTFIFMTAAPLILHSHRHIMFMNYIPFLLMGLFGVQKYVNENKKILLIISAVLIILTSYFFSIPALLVLFLYSIYLYLQKNKNINKKELITFIFKEALVFIIPVLITAFFLLPTFKAILNSRFETASESGILSNLIPELSFGNLLYSSYSLGLTAILILAISSAIITKRKELKFLAIIFIIITFFPIIDYLLNGFMYLNAKVYIPFLPLAILLIGNLLQEILNKKINIKKLLIVTIILSILGCVSYTKYDIFLIDIIFSLIVIIASVKLKKEYFLFLLIVPGIITCYYVNKDDNLATKEIIDNQYNKSLKEIINETTQDNNLSRVAEASNIFYNSNNVINPKEYKTTMYSSLTNKYFRNFYWNEFNNENPNRNDSIFENTNNVLYNLYSGNKYFISNENENIIGYEKIKSIGNYNLYKNDSAFSIGYTSSNLMSLEEYKKLSYPYNVEALMNYIIVDKEVETNYNTNIKEIEIEKDNYTLDLDKETAYNIKTKQSYKNKILIIRFDMNYTESCSVGDTYITINDISNKLTCRGWKYHNKNYTFEYVLSSNDEINNLQITLSKGKHDISNIKVYELDYNYVKNINESHSDFIIDKEETKGDIIKGSINAKEDGYFSLSIPYDEGFTILVDGKKQDYELVNTSFIGFEIEKGNHDIIIEYEAPLLKEGKIVSIVGIIIFASVLLIEQKRSKIK